MPDSGQTQGLVFISYRHDDATDAAYRLLDVLAQQFGDSVWMDPKGQPPGDMRRHLRVMVHDCQVFIPVIGPQWTGGVDRFGRVRLEDEEDWVRIELEAALEKQDIVVMPALVGGTPMPNPRELPRSLRKVVYQHAFPLGQATWERDVEHFSAAIAAALEDYPEGGPRVEVKKL